MEPAKECRALGYRQPASAKLDEPTSRVLQDLGRQLCLGAHSIRSYESVLIGVLPAVEQERHRPALIRLRQVIHRMARSKDELVLRVVPERRIRGWKWLKPCDLGQ